MSTTVINGGGWGSARMAVRGCGGRGCVGLKLLLLGAVIALACVLPSLGVAGGGDAVVEEVRDAVRRGDLEGLRERVGRDGVVGARDAEGNTPLILAAHLGSPEAVGIVLRAGGEVNATNASGATALLRGAANPEIVRRLVEAGAEVNAGSELGHTPLMLAARSPGATESVRLLLGRGAEVNVRSRFGATALMAAVAAGNREVVRLLLDRGADPNAVPMPDGPAGDPIWGGLRTPLMWAAYRGDTGMAGLLLERGARLEQVIPFGTPLTHAAWRGDEAMARFLVERGARVDVAEPFSGYGPLHWAASAESGDAGLVRFLISKGADVRAEGGQPVDAFLGVGQTPLGLAGLRGDTEARRVLARAAGEADRAVGASGMDRGGVTGSGSVGRDRLGSAVAAAMPALQVTAVRSRESFLRHASKQDCVSCHQQYFPLAAVAAGRRLGVGIDESAQSALLETVLANHRGTGLDAEPLFHPDAPHDYGYLMLALRLAGVGAGRGTDALVHHLASIQHGDGRWQVNLPRPPMQSSDVAATALAVHALRHFGWASRGVEFEGRVARAVGWLERAEVVTQEDRVYQILGLHWGGAVAGSLASKVAGLLEGQRGDGGWAQLPGLASDAYATGQAVYALKVAGGRGAAVMAAVDRGERYLVETQGEDGTWHVRRRAFPFQPTMDSGFPHGRDGWISATGTAWAVLALAEGKERLGGAEGVRVEGKAGGGVGVGVGRGGVPRAEAVDFVRHIQPVLERSCVPCHSGERARGNYRVTDRRALMSPGNAGLAPVIAGKSGDSVLLRYVSDGEADLAMPPEAKRGRYPGLTAVEVGRLRDWVDAGAAWPEGVVLGVAGRPEEVTAGLGAVR